MPAGKMIGTKMAHLPKSSQVISLSALEEAFKQIITEAAVMFPEGGSDLEKWEWCRVLRMTLFEASKRRGLSAEKITKHAHKRVRRILEQEKAEGFMAQEFPPMEEYDALEEA